MAQPGNCAAAAVLAFRNPMIRLALLTLTLLMALPAPLRAAAPIYDSSALNIGLN